MCALLDERGAQIQAVALNALEVILRIEETVSQQGLLGDNVHV